MLKKTAYRALRPFFSVKNVERQLAQVHRESPAALNERFLQEILSFAAEHNPYYRKFLSDGAGIEPLPVLTKEIIREHFSDLQSEGVNVPTYKNSSGGSTGKPQTFVQDMVFSSWSETAQEYYYREFLGIDPVAVKKVILWGSERDTFKEKDLKGQLTNWLTNSLFLNTFKLEEDQWVEYVERINRYQPYFIRGYAGSLYQIARAIKKHNLKVHRPHFLYSSAETLQGFMRQEIEEVFGAKVYDYYGSREVGAIAGECKHGHRHIFTFHNHVETVGLTSDAPTTEVGRILITNLHNYSMPLLRYQIGDVGAVSSDTCACGSPLPWFSELKGRITDHFITKTGTYIHGEYFTHLFYFRDWVEEFQVNQIELDRIQILVVSNSKASRSDIDDIETKTRLVMGADCQIEWQYVDEIPKTPQGKHLFTRSLVNR